MLKSSPIMWLRSGVATLLLATALSAGAAKAEKDQPALTVNGQDVMLSEFEYLYTDNLPADSIRENLDHYINLFVDYRLKLAEAYAEQLDTLPDLKKEYVYYRRDLARPYIEDETVIDSLIQNAYSHYLTNRDVWHLMVQPQTPTSSPEQQRELIDSLRSCIAGGELFGAIAERYSADPGAKTNGGHIGVVPVGRFPYQWEDMAYDTPVGTLSEVFSTPYGLHVLYVEAETIADSVPEFYQVRPAIEQAMKRDGRMNAGLQRRLEQLKTVYPSQILSAGRDSLEAVFTRCNGYNQEAHDELSLIATPLLQIADSVVTVADLSSPLPVVSIPVDRAMPAFDEVITRRINNTTLEMAIEAAEAQDQELAHMVSKFHDGLLIYEVTNRNVWEAGKDQKKQEEYFAQHRPDYAWGAPRYKGWIAILPSDTLKLRVVRFIDEHKNIDGDSLSTLLRKTFKGIRTEKVVTAQGVSPWVDYAVFMGERPQREEGSRIADVVPFCGRMIGQPEEVGDVRGAVARDYTDLLEQEWMASLREKYPVTIHRKAFKKIKPKE